MESGRKPSNSHTITFSGYSWQNLLGPNVILCSNSLQSEHKQHCNIYHSQHQFINTIHTASSLYLCTLTAQASLHLKTSSLTHHDPHNLASPHQVRHHSPSKHYLLDPPINLAEASLAVRIQHYLGKSPSTSQNAAPY
jgi:hypothetical protein